MCPNLFDSFSYYYIMTGKGTVQVGRGETKEDVKKKIIMVENDNEQKMYTFEDLERLANRISKIKKKKYLENIRDIIISCNPNINITENSNGILLIFNGLRNDTYSKIHKYIKKYENEKLNTITISSSPDMKNQDGENIKEEHHNNISDNPSNDINKLSSDALFNGNSRLKYSNREKNIIKKKMYDKELTETLSDSNTDSIFANAHK